MDTTEPERRVLEENIQLGHKVRRERRQGRELLSFMTNGRVYQGQAHGVRPESGSLFFRESAFARFAAATAYGLVAR